MPQSLWYDGQFDQPYPARHLFAPPLLSTMMEVISWIPGIARFAPFLPSVFLGTGTILALWWLARSWFGKPAGIFIAAVVAMSDFHIIYSRMALTDVACLFWIVLSVGLGTRAISRQCFETAAASGLVCGLAWWTKYTGWLPLAILCSGSGLWWMWHGRTSMTIHSVRGNSGNDRLVAAVTFAPWWWQLQPVGGYQAVSADARFLCHRMVFVDKEPGTAASRSVPSRRLHRTTLTGTWTVRRRLLRWTSGRSTWNTNIGEVPLCCGFGILSLTLPPMTVLLRFTAAAIAISVLSFRIRAPLMSICISIGGLSGIYLWPVLQRSWQRREHNDLSPTSPGALPLSRQIWSARRPLIRHWAFA